MNEQRIKPQTQNVLYDIWLNSTNSAEEVLAPFVAELEESLECLPWPKFPPPIANRGKLHQTIVQSPSGKI